MALEVTNVAAQVTNIVVETMPRFEGYVYPNESGTHPLWGFLIVLYPYITGLVAGAIAGVCESFQAVPVLSRDQVTMAHEDNVCQDNALVSVFGITPTSLAEALASYGKSRANAVPEAGLV